jgi:hypothetical protein
LTAPFVHAGGSLRRRATTKHSLPYSTCISVRKIEPMSEAPVTPAVSPPDRIWVAECAFKKNDFPSLGTFGVKVAQVVIIPQETWNRLCAEIPALATRQFEVGVVE